MIKKDVKGRAANAKQNQHAKAPPTQNYPENWNERKANIQCTHLIAFCRGMSRRFSWKSPLICAFETKAEQYHAWKCYLK